MDTQDLASLAAALGGCAVGLAGVVATFATGRRQQEVALAIAREQAERQENAARKDRQQRHLETAYSTLATWLAECEEEIQEMNHVLWRNGIEDDPPSIRADRGSFGRPAHVFKDSHMWTAEAWKEMRDFFEASRAFWHGCHKLHLVKARHELEKSDESRFLVSDQKMDLAGDIGRLDEAIDQVRNVLRADLLEPSLLTLGDMEGPAAKHVGDEERPRSFARPAHAPDGPGTVRVSPR